ncbi:DUF397 domain-containing protein [Streptomyces cyaneofuscatus]|uniref:DUF397 domain-containing protein n=1 Tax=Streptomyces cyaneofuscatus TaxID=66883 RepID=UPI00386A998E|nr:DUF397 domain-containing protein [Streptomyces cyaneofuscatus]
MMTESPRWFTSSYSANGGDCVEVAVNLVAARGIVPVRDSKRVDGPVVGVRTSAFSAFVAGVRAGTFDAVAKP